MQIREARSSDATAIRQLYRDVMGYEYPLERMKEMIEKTGRILVILRLLPGLAKNLWL